MESQYITFEEIKQSEEIRTYIRRADESLTALGFTEHSFAHVMKCAVVAGGILQKLGYDRHTADLARIAGYMHDIGNVINRHDHAQSGAVMAFHILDKLSMSPDDISAIITAIGNHDEATAAPVSAISAALILADKTDVRRSRVRSTATIDFDIHDRVNYAVETSELELNDVDKTFTLKMTIDTEICPVMEYFEIFLSRMLLCRKSADFFGLTFHININGQTLL